jgi:Tol biopolymer transport system component
MALLAFTILAACAKEEINIPDNPPPPPPPNQVWADTGYKTPVEVGTVSAPCIYVSTFDVQSYRYSAEKYNLEGSKRQQVIDPVQSSWPYFSTPGFSPSGEFMVFGDREGLQMRDMRTNLTSLICDIPGRAVGNVQISPDQGKLAFNGLIADGPVFGDLYVVDARPGATPVNLTNSEGDEILSVPAFSPDGVQIAYTSWGVMYVTDLEGGRKTVMQKDYSYWTADPVYTRDGLRIIYTAGTGWLYEGGEIFIAAVAEGGADKGVKLTEARQYGLKRAYTPMLSPDGTTLYFLGETYTGLVHLYAMPANGGAFRMVAPCVSATGLDTRLTFIAK